MAKPYQFIQVRMSSKKLEKSHKACHQELTDSKSATLLFYDCRKTRRNLIDASVPIYLINTPADLDTLLVRNDLTPDKSVLIYRDLLNASLAAKWDGRVRSKGKAVQAGFFDKPETEQQSLL